MATRPGLSKGARWMGVGQSADSDSRRAGAQATSAALVGADPKLLVVFCSAAHDLPQLLASINETSGGVPLVGCSTAGEIATSGPGDGGVVVAALGGDGFSVATAAARSDSPDRLRDAAAQAASCVREVQRREHQVLLLLTDGLAGDQQEIVRGAYDVAGPRVPLVGGCAGDDLKMVATHQLHGNQALESSVVAAALSSDAPFGIGVRHGWQVVGERVVVTSSAEARVFTLDDEPALDLYLERLNAPKRARSDPSAFTDFALTHPLALGTGSQERQMRFIGGADFDERSLITIANVPQGGLAWFSTGDQHSVLEAADSACTAALDALGDRPPLGALAFDCIARRGILGGPGIASEVDRIATRTGGAPVAGFYTYGEIARSKGVNGFHNQTLVVLAVS